jgi:hypothetical protein
MSSTQLNGGAAPEPKVAQETGPYAPWPDGLRGYVVLDLRTERPVAGPFPRPEEAFAAAARWNEHPA